MLPRFEQFIRERQYLKNVSPATISWHTHNLKWLKSESPSQEELNDAVIRMREKGLRATGCNSAIRSINAYLRWAGIPHHLNQMKEPQLILATFTPSEVKLLINWKPTNFYDKRLHLLVLILFDTGCRASEALGIRVGDIDLSDMLVTLDGKGSKQRRVPISLNLRKHLYSYTRGFAPGDFVPATRDGHRLDRHIALRDVKRLPPTGIRSSRKDDTRLSPHLCLALHSVWRERRLFAEAARTQPYRDHDAVCSHSDE